MTAYVPGARTADLGKRYRGKLDIIAVREHVPSSFATARALAFLATSNYQGEK